MRLALLTAACAALLSGDPPPVAPGDCCGAFDSTHYGRPSYRVLVATDPDGHVQTLWYDTATGTLDYRGRLTRGEDGALVETYYPEGARCHCGPFRWVAAAGEPLAVAVERGGEPWKLTRSSK